MKGNLGLVLCLFVLFSCARVGSPVGGAKDTIPPVFTGSNIDTTRTNIGRSIGELRLDFDEYVTLKDVSRNLTISPPIKLKKVLPTMLGSKTVLVQWEGDLQENTTYNFNFGNAIADLNEGNVLPYFTFAFSTGPKLDELYITGDIFDGMKPKPTERELLEGSKNNFVVGLYKAEDSLDFRKKPYYIAKADEQGYFELNYLSPGQYRLVAFNDENQNSVVDPGKESVGFPDYTIDLDSSISSLPIELFPSSKPVRYVETKAIAGGAELIFEGNPEQIQVTTDNSKLTDFKVLHRKYSDTARVYFDGNALGIGISQSENIKFKYVAEDKSGDASVFYRQLSDENMTLSNVSGAVIKPSSKMLFESNFPITSLQTQNWKLQQDSTLSVELTARIVENNPFKFELEAPFEQNEKYSLTIPRQSVLSYYTSNEKAYEFNFTVDRKENYGTLVVQLANLPDKPFWIQLLDEKQLVVTNLKGPDNAFTFENLSPGIYSLRILVDENENGFWDSANLNTLERAERVVVFPKKMEIRPLWENREYWDVQSNTTQMPETELDLNSGNDEDVD